MLDAVSLVPGQVEPWLLESLGVADDDAVEECISAGVLRPTIASLEFRHELARQTVHDEVNPLHRRELHRRVLATLLDPGSGHAEPAEVAFHAEEAGDDAVLAEYGPIAAEAARAAGAHRAAAGHLSATLELAGALDDPRRAELHERLGRELFSLDQLSEAVAAYDEARVFWRRSGTHNERAPCSLRRSSRSPCRAANPRPKPR